MVLYIVISSLLELMSLQVDERDSWLHEDYATCHMFHETMTFLRDFFGDRLISKDLWPRDLHTCAPISFSWATLKEWCTE
jgi:hypothetical protein